MCYFFVGLGIFFFKKAYKVALYTWWFGARATGSLDGVPVEFILYDNDNVAFRTTGWQELVACIPQDSKVKRYASNVKPTYICWYWPCWHLMFI